MRKSQAFKQRGEAEWFKRTPQAYNQVNHDKVISGLVVQCVLTL